MIIDFPNFGYILENLPHDLFQDLKKETEYFKDQFDKEKTVNDWLAGNIEKEFRLRDNETKKNLESYVLSLGDRYNQRYKYDDTLQIFSGMKEYVMDQHCWMNFQLKHQFNPTHNHSGVFSFVIWIEIPYTIEEERQVSPGKHALEDMAGHFQFMYNDSLGRAATMPLAVDKSFEGKILFFPAKIFHSVYPFYSSDDYRISIAGNILLK